jgi:hypothetical protein
MLKDENAIKGGGYLRISDNTELKVEINVGIKCRRNDTIRNRIWIQIDNTTHLKYEYSTNQKTDHFKKKENTRLLQSFFFLLSHERRTYFLPSREGS